MEFFAKNVELNDEAFLGNFENIEKGERKIFNLEPTKKFFWHSRELGSHLNRSHRNYFFDSSDLEPHFIERPNAYFP